ncbi:MAG TPA: nucleotidyltransferase family protein [Candidatus Binataceae bacterium]|nr:nucleotidyltransferase family protein [Candidatus Binataceae bacterium]
MTDSPQYPVSREAAFLAAAVRRFLDPEAAAPDPVGIDPGETLRLAIAHSIVPMVYRTLQESTTTHELAGIFRPAFEEDLHSSLALGGELCAIADLFATHSLEFVPLKGSLLSRRLYGDLAVRVSGDIDVLIQPHDVLAVRDLLLAQGYRIASPLHWSCDSACLRSRECELLMVHRTRPLTVDLHWRIVPWYFASAFDSASVWKSLVSTRISGRQIPDLPPEHLLLFLCAHGSKHAFERLAWICDIARCLQTCDFEWQAVLSLAARSGTTRQLLLGTRLAAGMMGVRLPADLPEDPAVEPLVRFVTERLLAARPAPTPEAELIPFCLKMFESPRHRMRYLAGHFSPSDAEYQILHLPPALHFLYYPFRPLRLAAKYALGLGRRLATPTASD